MIYVGVIRYSLPFYAFEYILMYPRRFHERIRSKTCIKEWLKSLAKAVHFILFNKIWKTPKYGTHQPYLNSNKLPVELLVIHVHELRVEPCVVRDHPELIVEVELSNVMFPFPLSYHLPSQSKGRTHEPSNFSKWNTIFGRDKLCFHFHTYLFLKKWDSRIIYN